MDISKENPYVNALEAAREEVEATKKAYDEALRRRRDALMQAIRVGYLSVSKAAKELGISRALTYRILKEEKLPDGIQ